MVTVHTTEVNLVDMVTVHTTEVLHLVDMVTVHTTEVFPTEEGCITKRDFDSSRTSFCSATAASPPPPTDEGPSTPAVNIGAGWVRLEWPERSDQSAREATAGAGGQ